MTTWVRSLQSYTSRGLAFLIRLNVLWIVLLAVGLGILLGTRSLVLSSVLLRHRNTYGWTDALL